ncbi:hypothetical protein [Salsuginibacillus kocurii]|uniref:hypothetical protein n=1 Tax=Salsuginibacillus kocurii TaxID=427078 RepID=UPI00036F38D1|nr:hypothetical protein [Salsuginibacillus kocurii]
MANDEYQTGDQEVHDQVVTAYNQVGPTLNKGDDSYNKEEQKLNEQKTKHPDTNNLPKD